MRLEFSIYRYNPDVNDASHTQDYVLGTEKGRDMMLLDAPIQLKEKNLSLSFRRSCHEGVYGSNGLNISGKNGPACIAPISALNQPGKKIVIHPLPGLSMICDLVVDMGQLHAQYEKTRPHSLNNGQNSSAREHLQTSEQCEKPDGLYGCILCACCSTSRPSFQWNSDKLIDLAGLLTAYRSLIDNRDTETDSRLDGPSDAFSAFCCHGIMNCVNIRSKGLNPTRVTGHIKSVLLQRNA